jgi:tetratricopeptide (TPR) repeat protein
LLAELLAERGETARAEKLRAKAEALAESTNLAEHSLESLLPEQADDLIAFAERQERSHQSSLSPRQVVAGLAAFVALIALIAGIVFLTRPGDEPEASRGSAAAAVDESTDGSGPTIDIEAAEEVPTRLEQLEEVAPAEPEPAPVELEEPPEPVAPEPIQEAVSVEAPAVAASPIAPSPARKPAAKAQPAEKPTAKRAKSVFAAKPEPPPPPRHPEPDAATVRAELASMSPHELSVRGETLYRQGHTAIAASYFRRALDIDPDFAPALVGIGRSILRAEKYSEAMSNATRALHLARGVDARPGLEAEAIYQIGRVHLHRGDLDAARRLFRQSISLSGTPSAAWFYLGEALWNDNSPAAREAYEKYLALVPDGPLAIRARRAIQ